MSRTFWMRVTLILAVLWLCDCVAPRNPGSVEYRPPATEGPGEMQIARLGQDSGNTGAFEKLKTSFEDRNPGYRIAWNARMTECSAGPVARLLFVQRGESEGSVIQDADQAVLSKVAVGDIVVLRPGESFLVEPAIGVLTFAIPHELPAELPAFIRPDWDSRITDTPGGCATETGAYRRILLTWLKEKGPYTLHSLNAHRVRITDSFTHYHPVEGGFDEFYLVQMVQPGGRIITSSRVDLIEGGDLSLDDVPGLLEETELAVGDLVYLPRGVVHRGVGGVLAQVITVPGFRPGAEIGVDHHLLRLNGALGLSGDRALPFNRDASTEAIVK